MLINNLKESLQTYASHLHTIDYLALGWLLLLFFCFFILALAVIRRKPFLALFIILMDLGIILVGPFAAKWYIDDRLRSSETTLTLVKQLQFSDMLIVEGTIKNTSNKDFQTCLTHLNVVKTVENPYKNLLLELKPLRKQSIVLEMPPTRQAQSTFRAIFEGFRYEGDFNVTVNTECY